MRVFTACFVLCAMALVAADDPKKETSLKGTWLAVSMKQAGKALPDEALKDFKCKFEEKSYSNVVNGETIEEGDYTFDDSKSPKTIDFDIKKGHDEGKKQVGIYKIEDDKVTMVLAMPGEKDRPTSFEPKEGSDVFEVVLKREKP